MKKGSKRKADAVVGGTKRSVKKAKGSKKSKQGEAMARNQAKLAAKAKNEKLKKSTRNRLAARKNSKSKNRAGKKSAATKRTKRKPTKEEMEQMEQRMMEEDDIPSELEVSDEASDESESSTEGEPEKVYVRTKKRNRKKLKSHEKLPIYVVDEHDGTMVCLLRNIETGHLPMEGIKLVHFDSHPDLGNIPDAFNGFDDLHNKKYNIHELYSKTDIATWITPMSLMGHVDFVVWACGYWCDQFNPGTWKLLVGKDKNDGRIKIAAPGNKKLVCLEYWESGDSVCKVQDFEYYREWTFMVVRYGKNCRLPKKQAERLTEELQTGTWVLDIDEDFFSCNNPYFDEFRDLFGEKTHKMLSTIYGTDAEDTPEMEETLMSMFRKKSYTKSWSRFSKSVLGQKLVGLLNCPNKKKVLKEFHAFLRKNWPNGGMDEESEEEIDLDGWDVRDFFTLDDLHRTGQLACLPHHISTAKEIKELVNEVDVLFDSVPPPTIITVATSRLDRYLPDSQAATIHNFVETMLRNRFDDSEVFRLDKPHFSVDSGESGEQKKNSRFVTEILEPEPEDKEKTSSAADAAKAACV